MNLQSSFTYDNFGRRTSRTLQLNNTTIASAGRSYDTFGRIASVSNGTDTLSYTYRPGGQLSLSGWTNGQNSAMSNQSYEYDQYNRLTGIKLNNVNEISYTLNAKDQRTAATYANAGLWYFTYDDKGQVTGANGSSKSYAYSYDGIGNRLTANENSTVSNYTSNLLNQYTLINNTAPEYDADGNMTTSGNGWAYTYNGENRITQATKGSTTVTMAYDYAGRRISKTVTASGVIQNSYKYVYDGFKLIAVYNNNDLVMTFTWQPESLGMDVPVSMTYSGTTYYYVTDGNKNVTALLDASGNRVAEYVYGPFGQTVSATGAMAPINPFRFSSEFHDDETGLVYYNYRYYSPELGRWTKRDPIGEKGELNLFAITHNNLIYGWDYLGYDSVTFGDIVKHTLLIPSYVGGFVVSVFSGDIFWPSKEPKFSNKGCGFLITINGIWNLKDHRDQFKTAIKDLPQFSDVKSNENALHLHNPTTFIGDFVQILGDEIGLINITSIRAAKYINAAGDQAIKNKCKCFTIHVVAHSQGTSVFRNALPLIKEKYKKHINYIGLGGQRLANFTWGIGNYQNHINVDDFVPMLNFYNPLHIEDAIFSLFDGKKSDFHWRSGGWGVGSHPWENNYYQYLK